MTNREKLAEARDHLRDAHNAALDYDGLPRTSLFAVFSEDNPYVVAAERAAQEYITLRDRLEAEEYREQYLRRLLHDAHQLVGSLDEQALKDEGENKNGRLHRAASAAALAATLLRRELDGEPEDEDPSEA